MLINDLSIQIFFFLNRANKKLLIKLLLVNISMAYLFSFVAKFI